MKKKKKEQSLKALSDTTKQMYVIGHPNEEREKKGAKAYLKK